MPEKDRTILRTVRVIDPSDGTDRTADVLVENGVLTAVEPCLPEMSDALEMDSTGSWLFPGLIDMHVHLRVPGDGLSETLETGLKAAVAGGITTVAMMPNTDPPLDSPDLVEELLRSCSSVGLVDALVVACVTRGRRGEEPVDFEALHSSGTIAFSDDGSPVAAQTILREALQRTGAFGGVIIEHPEDTDLSAGGVCTAGPVANSIGVIGISEESESGHVAACLATLRGSGGRLHLTHLSSPESIRLVADAASRGEPVTCDVTPHHITLSDDAVLEFGPDAKMNPPLRSEESRRRLMEYVSSGAVDAMASDHAPHCAEHKKGTLDRVAFGITGLETMFPLILEILRGQGGMSPLQVISLVTTGPACILGLDPPSLTPGRSRAFVLFDPDAEYTLAGAGTFSLSCNTPFLNRPLRGRVRAVWNGGLIYREDSFDL